MQELSCALHAAVSTVKVIFETMNIDLSLCKRAIVDAE